MSEPSKITNLSDEELDQVSGGGTFEENIATLEAYNQQVAAYKPTVSDTKPV